MRDLAARQPAISGVAQRRFHRVAVEGTVRLYSGNAAWNTELVDLSLSGVQVLRPDSWSGKVGSHYRLDLRLEGGILISMSVELARIDEEAGLGFVRRRIDLDSFTQLKRLIELNLGNDFELKNELSLLG